MSLYVGLYTGLSAIRAGQAGIDTASHNIANANTVGYTRQRVELAGAIPFDSPDGPIGTGVDVTAVTRLRDHFLDLRVRATGAQFARLDVRSQLLARTETVTGEPDSGVGVELGRLWDTFEDLALDPQDPAVRRQVLTQLDALASRVRSVDAGWAQLGADTTARRDATVAEVAGLLDGIADVNRQVANQDPLTVSNDLLDRRDAQLDRLAELTGATATRQPDGTVTVSLGGVDLVAGAVATPLAVASGSVTAGGVDVTGALSGELAALHEFVTATLPGQRAQLDAFATDLVAALDARHALGHTATGATGGPLLAGTDAASLQVAITSPADLAVAGSAVGGVVGALDGANAQALADLRTTAVVGGQTLDQVHQSMTVDLGAQVAGSQRAARAAGDVAVSAEVARQSQHGVSLDEEMVDLVRFQRQLEAAGRVMTAIDQALDTLVNRVGIVGR